MEKCRKVMLLKQQFAITRSKPDLLVATKKMNYVRTGTIVKVGSTKITPKSIITYLDELLTPKSNTKDGI